MILAIDTSGKGLGFALCENGDIKASQLTKPGLRHGEILQSALADFLNANRIGFADITGLAVTMGPGSFTGLRIGLAAAKGYCYAFNLPLAGTSTLLAAASLCPGKSEKLIVVADAGRNELYYAMFDCTKDTPSRLVPDSIGCPDKITGLAEKDGSFCGPEHLKEQIIAGVGQCSYYNIDDYNLAIPAALEGETAILKRAYLDIKTATPVYVRSGF